MKSPCCSTVVISLIVFLVVFQIALNAIVLSHTPKQAQRTCSRVVVT